MLRASTTTLALLVALASTPVGVELALANGGEGKRIVYRGTLRTGDGAGHEVQFDTEVEPLFFRVATVRNKYRIVRIRVRNRGGGPLGLSAAGDAVQVQFRGGSVVSGLLDLGARDPAVWEGLPADLRNVIVYPRVVPGGEEGSIFVFLPAAELTEVPEVFRYTLASRPDRPVLIRDVSAAVAH
jgi:hypothetical protein